jgi:hypothetical protein
MQLEAFAEIHQLLLLLWDEFLISLHTDSKYFEQTNQNWHTAFQKASVSTVYLKWHRVVWYISASIPRKCQKGLLDKLASPDDSNFCLCFEVRSLLYPENLSSNVFLRKLYDYL